MLQTSATRICNKRCKYPSKNCNVTLKVIARLNTQEYGMSPSVLCNFFLKYFFVSSCFFEIFQRFEINWTCCISYMDRKLRTYACICTCVYNSEYTCMHITMAWLGIEIVTIKRGKEYSAEIERSSLKECRLVVFHTTRYNLEVKLPLYRTTRFLSISVLRAIVI